MATSSELLTVEKQLISKEFHSELQITTKFKLNMATQCMFAMEMIKSNSALQNCTAESIIKSIKDVALLGLSLNPKLQQAYLVPRKGQCCLDPSYQGMITKLHEYKAAKDIFAHVIYKGDDFEFDFMENRPTRYTPYHILGVDKGDEVGVFVCGIRFDDYKQYVYIPISRINEVMENTEAYKYAMSQKKANKSYYTIWEGANRPEMIKKTAIRYLWKVMPKSEDLSELGEIMEFHDTANNQTDTDFVKPDVQIKTKDAAKATAAVDRAAAKAKPIPEKKDEQKKQTPETVEIIPTKEGMDEFIALLKGEYGLDGRNTRTHNEVKELEELLSERGFTKDAISERIAKGGKTVTTYNDFMHVGTDEMFLAVLTKILEIQNSEQK
jgi:recombination protein RecT